MNRINILIMNLLLVCTAALPLRAQSPNPQQLPDTPPPEPVCTTTVPQPVIIQGSVLGRIGRAYTASGNVLFMRGYKRITASDAYYNPDTDQGILHNVFFTTCAQRNPDYHITASEIRILPHNRIRARNVALYLGRFKVLALPALLFRVGGHQASTALFPRPGFDAKDGFWLAQRLRLADTDRNRLVADLRFTTNHGVRGEIFEQYGIDGELQDFLGRFLSYESLRSSVLNLPEEPVNQQCDPQDLRPPSPARTRAYGRFTFNQRTYDVRNQGLAVSAQPELGVSYLGPQIYLNKQKLDPRLEIHSELNASWGRFKESPGLVSFTGRENVNGVFAPNILSLGPNTTIQPIGYINYSHYDNGDDYRILAGAADASHLFPGGSFVSLRYIKRSDSGVTPFLFDRLDIAREAQAAAKLQMGRHSLGFVTRYDLDTSNLYEWEVFYGHRSDCLKTWVRWNNRLRRLALDVTLVNLP